MNMRTRAGSLVAVLMVGVALATASVGEAEAKPKRPVSPADSGVRCVLPGAAVGSSNDQEFYMEGELVSVVDSNGVRRFLYCANDGNWIVAAPQKDNRQVAPQSATRTR